jgi:GNAT superfamily N-acetyltransferase
MELIFRETQAGDIESMFSVRARTRQNPISREKLASYGITAETSAADMANGRVKGWACFDGLSLIGFCNADASTGEVLVLAVLPDYEGQGIGSRLLALASEWLCSMGFTKLWLAASPNPNIRAYGFYRSLGWRPNGTTLENGDQVLVYELGKV